MPGNQDQSGLVPVRWSDGSPFYRRTWPETVSTLTPDLLGDCPVQARLKPVAGEAAGPEALPALGRRGNRKPRTCLGTHRGWPLNSSSLGGLRRKVSRCL